MCNDLFREMEWMKKLGFVQASFISDFKQCNRKKRQVNNSLVGPQAALSKAPAILTNKVILLKKVTSYIY